MAVVPGAAGSILTLQTSPVGPAELIVVYDDAKSRATASTTASATRFVFADSQTIITGSFFSGSIMGIWKLSSNVVTYSASLPGSASDYPVAYADGLVLGHSGRLDFIRGKVPIRPADHAGWRPF